MTSKASFGSNLRLGGRRILKATQQLHIEDRETFLQRITISPSGDNRLDIAHPSLSKRIEKIEHALEERGVVIDEEEDDKIDDLIFFLTEHSRLIQYAATNTEQPLEVIKEFYST